MTYYNKGTFATRDAYIETVEQVAKDYEAQGERVNAIITRLTADFYLSMHDRLKLKEGEAKDGDLYPEEIANDIHEIFSKAFAGAVVSFMHGGFKDPVSVFAFTMALCGAVSSTMTEASAKLAQTIMEGKRQ